MSEIQGSETRPATTLFPHSENDGHPLISLADAPNPKPTASDKKSYGRLSSLYTAFSTDFAEHALDLCIAMGHRKILDPFAGMGTLGEAARAMPIQLTLNDLNPFAALSSLFRTSSRDALLQAIDRTRSVDVSSNEISEKAVFLGAMGERLRAGATVSDLLQRAVVGDHRAEALTAHLLALVRMATHRKLRGSNPTWTKRSADGPANPETLKAAVDDVLSQAENYARHLKPLASDFAADCRCGDIKNLVLPAASVDAIITSPPYPNRTDYIRHYLPAAELLLGGRQDAEREIREAQIGTPLIRPISPNPELPLSVIETIEAVRRHDSYASERYYAKGFLYYFSDMRLVFKQFASWLKEGGSAILVVQDTHYKEIRIPVADLLIDVAADCGLVLQSKKNFRVRQTLARLSPHSRALAPGRESFETAFAVTKISR